MLQGPIVNLPEAYVTFTWGDGQHDLYQQWSVANPTLGRGWFYGSTYFPGSSNADVYVYRWYFQTDGTGNFSQPTPVQASTWGSIKALLK